ncbi:MAG TPA: hemin uptake protein HemP [Reyranella sp.]
MSPTPPSSVEQLAERERNDGGQAIPIVDSATLMGGRRELIIQHGSGSYRLRVTASNKLILTK